MTGLLLSDDGLEGNNGLLLIHWCIGLALNDYCELVNIIVE